MSESWGCEFLDDGNFGKQFKGKILQYVPIEVIENAVDPRYLAEIRVRDSLLVDDLAMSIQAIGFKEPGILLVSDERIKLQEGNHRFLAAQKLGLKKFPVIIEAVSSNPAGSKSLKIFTSKLLEITWQDQS